MTLLSASGIEYEHIRGGTVQFPHSKRLLMDETVVLDHGNVPDREHLEKLDVRDLPPPKPLQETLETLEALGDDAMLVQINDRTPKHLLPKLEERGYVYESVGDGPAYTVIWIP